ncbi:hypothetical protein DM02DRAFT_525301 [Periconia macrospinosa]|uniref:Uncharacterized protein n=1 Tax=Periconia macrospinosa TaxID=97972 RepID=A0A2V1DTQ2_9PLEO|nr:hypothetical protein DM02DRAFT_525301 [Periconia macrospinosa]
MSFCYCPFPRSSKPGTMSTSNAVPANAFPTTNHLSNASFVPAACAESGVWFLPLSGSGGIAKCTLRLGRSWLISP